MKCTSLKKVSVDRQQARQKHLLPRSVHASLTKAVCGWLRHFDLYTHMKNKPKCCMQTSQHTACKQVYMHRSRCQWMQTISWPAKLLSFCLSMTCLVPTYLRASYVPGATTDRKPVAKVLLHVLAGIHKHCQHQTDIAWLRILHTDSQSIYRQSIHLQTFFHVQTVNTCTDSQYRQSVQTVN